MILHGDLFDVLPTLDAASFDACVTDPPYGIGFMGREWDTFKPGTGKTRKLMHPREREAAKIVSDNPNIHGRHRSPALSPSQIDYDYSAAGLRAFQGWCEQWGREVFRVLKPGAYILSCGAPRAYHRMASGLEDAGFEVRDCLAWLFGSGFPKSLNIGDGLGTALKPAHEPILLARKPFKGSVRANVATYGTGALNVDACRLDAGAGGYRGDEPSAKRRYTDEGSTDFAMQPGPRGGSELGRWPANVVIDEIAAMVLDDQSGELVSGANPTHRGADKFRDVYGEFKGQAECDAVRGLDVGGASRFYYVAKPSREERDLGCEHLPRISAAEITGRQPGSAGLQNPRAGVRAGSMDRDVLARAARNIHPTVKPLALMRWLVRLVTPPNGRVLDPFGGSGTTGMACVAEGRDYLLIEREAEYIPIIEARVRSIAPLFHDVAETIPPDVRTSRGGLVLE